MIADQLRELLDYDPATGLFRWKVRRKGIRSYGWIAGTLAKNGYCMLRVSGRSYYAHRLAWMWMTGSECASFIDHINGVPTDNRWGNLRPATQSQNMANARQRLDNTLGARGLRFDKRAKAKPWGGLIWVDRKPVWVGSFNEKEEAVEALKSAIQQHHGEFARA